MWTAANHNQYVKDNLASGVPDLFTTKGDIAVATAADVGARQGVGANGGFLVANSAVTNGLQWSDTFAGKVYLNDTDNTFMTVGLTLNQGVNEDEILAFKNSNVAHGMTSIVETDTYATFGVPGGAGGLVIKSYAESGTGSFELWGTTVTGDTTRATTAQAPVDLRALKKTGTTNGGMGANENLLVVRDNLTTRFILDSDGDSHQDIGTAWTNFDEHDDAALLTALAVNVTRADDPLRAAFGDFLSEQREQLAALELVTFNADGHHFVNMSRLTMLLVGAVRQQARQLKQLEQKLSLLTG